MNKFKAALLSLAFIGIVSIAKAEMNPSGPAQVYCVTGSSIQVFEGSGYFYMLANSSGNGLNYSIAMDTIVIANVLFDAFTSTHTLTPAIFFSSTTNLAGGIDSDSRRSKWWLGDGIWTWVKNGLFVFKTAASSGEANKTFIYYKK